MAFNGFLSWIKIIREAAKTPCVPLPRNPSYGAQYFPDYSKILWDEGNLGTISKEEKNSLVRKMLGQVGPPPEGAKRSEENDLTGIRA
jgi:hypothetical protein